MLIKLYIYADSVHMCLLEGIRSDTLGSLVLPLRAEAVQVDTVPLDALNAMLKVVDLRLHAIRVQASKQLVMRLHSSFDCRNVLACLVTFRYRVNDLPQSIKS